MGQDNGCTLWQYRSATCMIHNIQSNVCTVQTKTGHLMSAHARPINPLGMRVTTIGWKLVHLSHGWSNWQSQLASSVESI